ncbi:MAG: DUF4365 domain-containing protein [Anaerolineae bacterium]
MQTKKVSRQSIIGQQGANLIERIVLQMKNVWRPLLIFDVGVDGEIEICDPNTGAATNAILRVQAKATTLPFQAETDRTFEFICDERDLEYWLNGNTTIILVVCRPSTDEAYWVSVNDYFSDQAVRKTRKVVFDKTRDCFDAGCAPALSNLALPKDKGLYLAPLSVNETLYSNLLKVTSFAPKIWIASTEYRKPGEVWTEFKSRSVKVGAEWMLKNKQIISFYDLEQSPFSAICDMGSIESFDASEWAFSDDLDRKNEFIRLLKLALGERNRLLGLRYDKDREYYYFPAPNNLRTRKISYMSLKRKVPREVFKAYRKKNSPKDVSYCRHSAFRGKFIRLQDTWYLELTPTYHFTWDGSIKDKFGAERLKGIKRLERNPAVIGQLLMWANYLGTSTTFTKDMFDSRYPFLSFGHLETVEISGGIPDDTWYNSEEGNQHKSLTSQDNQLSLLGL